MEIDDSTRIQSRFDMLFSTYTFDDQYLVSSWEGVWKIFIEYEGKIISELWILTNEEDEFLNEQINFESLVTTEEVQLLVFDLFDLVGIDVRESLGE